jgi:transcriptional regulator with XRE-family HTH domain
MQLIKTSEKLLVWMHRNKYTQQDIAFKMGITRQFLARKIEYNSFTVGDLMNLKRLGFE